MEPSRVETDRANACQGEDDFERLIRLGLQDSVAQAEPSPEVWPKVLARVKEMSASDKRPRRLGRGAVLSLASMVQAVVISSLLLALGLNLDQGPVLPGEEYAHSSTPIVRKSKVRGDMPADALRGYVLLRMEREQAEGADRAGYRRGFDKGW